MKTLFIFLGIFSNNPLINVLASILVIIFLAWLIYYGIGKIKDPFEFRTPIYIFVLVALVALFLLFIGIFPG